jgi:hypothetical protein
MFFIRKYTGVFLTLNTNLITMRKVKQSRLLSFLRVLITRFKIQILSDDKRDFLRLKDFIAHN